MLIFAKLHRLNEDKIAWEFKDIDSTNLSANSRYKCLFSG
jgi:hypothetical protein